MVGTPLGASAMRKNTGEFLGGPTQTSPKERARGPREKPKTPHAHTEQPRNETRGPDETRRRAGSTHNTHTGETGDGREGEGGSALVKQD